MTTIINGSSPSVTFSDGTTQTTAGLPLTGGTVTGNVTATSFTPTGNTVPTTGIYLPSANTIGISTTNTLALNIDSSGRMTLPKQPRFFASLSGSTQTVTSGNLVTATYGNVLFDTTSSYNASTYTYTAPVAGVYQFNVRMRVDGISGGYSTLTLVTPFKTYISIASATASYSSFQIACLANLAAGNTAYVTVDSSGQTITLINTQPTYADFSGFLVG
jgi:hypothetical protein